MVTAQPAAVARPRLCQKMRARVLWDVCDQPALARALRDGAVPLCLVCDRGYRAAQVVRHGPRAFVLVERPLYRGSLCPVELEVLPLPLICRVLILSLAAGPLLALLRTRVHGLNRTRSTESDRKDKVFEPIC